MWHIGVFVVINAFFTALDLLVGSEGLRLGLMPHPPGRFGRAERHPGVGGDDRLGHKPPSALSAVTSADSGTGDGLCLQIIREGPGWVCRGWVHGSGVVGLVPAVVPQPPRPISGDPVKHPAINHGDQLVPRPDRVPPAHPRDGLKAFH
jgi:hypothetical protein